jgi:hypothetical protein
MDLNHILVEISRLDDNIDNEVNKKRRRVIIRNIVRMVNEWGQDRVEFNAGYLLMRY